MRAKLPVLAASALLLICSVLIFRQMRTNEDSDIIGKPQHVIHSAVTRPDKKAAEPLSEITGSETILRETAPPVMPNTIPGKPPLGIQLADEVQLPAVIMAVNATMQNPSASIPKPIAAAMQGIVDRFYQDLAAGHRDEAGDTLVVRPGPEVDRARERANESYRLLFGEEAFNKLTVNAALEARLPIDQVSTGK